MEGLFKIVRFLFGLYFFLYVLIHILMAVHPFIVNYGIFMNLVTVPTFFRNLENPKIYGLEKVHNFYLQTESDVRVGIWHYLPEDLKYDYEKHAGNSVKAHFETYFKSSDGKPIILYVHGNDGDRARGNRRALCNKLRAIGYHVFAIDYRGYGDSTGWPSEKGVVHDVMTLYSFIKSYQKISKVFIWGHSLGTGISAHAAKILSEFDSSPDGVVLEAPFVNISRGAKDYILAPLILNNRWIINKLDENLDAINLRLNTDKNILQINSKILILHAEDDGFIPLDHAKQLVSISKKRPAHYPKVEFIEYEKELKLGHNSIHMHEELYTSVKAFIEEEEETKKK